MYRKLLKRVFDFIIALILLILLLPIILPIIVILGLTGEREVFYLQTRIGYKNEPFKIWKFATMVKNSANMGTGSLTLRNDPRVTNVGKFLRITKINELPQLINVLKGDMSIVGARPQMLYDFEKFSDSIQSIIYQSKPGITGIGSIVFRDEEKIISNSSLPPHECDKYIISPYKGLLEEWYQDNISLANDMKLVFITGIVVFGVSSKIVFNAFRSLPKLPENLHDQI